MILLWNRKPFHVNFNDPENVHFDSAINLVNSKKDKEN